MFRSRVYVQVRLGRHKEWLEVAEKMNELRRARGWFEATTWVWVAGKANEVIIEIEYPDLAAFEDQTNAFRSDAEAMTLLRSTLELVVDGSIHSELVRSAPTQLA